MLTPSDLTTLPPARIPQQAPESRETDPNDVYALYYPLVRRIALRCLRSLPATVTADDVVAAGWLGMVEAVGRRTPGMTDDHFEAFASYRVRGAILDHLRVLDPLSRRLRGASRKIEKVVSDLKSRLGETPEEEQVAVELGLSLVEYQLLSSEISQAGSSGPLDEGPEVAATDGCPEERVTRRELAKAICSAIDGLPERTQLVLSLYYQKEYSFREIGEQLGVTESRVCQLHSDAIGAIRLRLEQVPQKYRSVRPPRRDA